MDIPWIWPENWPVPSCQHPIFPACWNLSRSTWVCPIIDPLKHKTCLGVDQNSVPQKLPGWNGLSNKSTYIHKLCCCSQVWILNHSKPTASHQKKGRMNGSFSQSPAAFQIPNCCHQGTQLGAVKGIVLECLVDPSGYRLVVIAVIAFQKDQTRSV